MDTASLITLVKKSYILSDAQRAYWLTQLPHMNDAQTKKLEEVLAGTDQLPFQKELESYLLSLGQSLANLYAVKA